MPDNSSRDIWIAGAFAAFTVDLLVYPLDTIKTRIQSPDYQKLYTHGANGAVNRASLFRGLYQGLGSVIVATLPSSGAFFTTYEGAKTLLAHTPLATPVSHSLASSIAELVACAILTPAEVIKQNAQMVSSSNSGGSATLRTMAKFRSNPLALWRGYGALASRNLPFTALQFPMFERLKTYLRDRRREQGKFSGSILEHATITAVAGGTAGSIAAVITTPVDVVKTRIMLAAVDSAGDAAESSSSPSKNGKPILNALGQAMSTEAPRKGSLQIAKEVIAERGVAKGLFRGGALRAVWTMIGSGLYLGVYEGGRLWLAQRDKDADDE